MGKNSNLSFASSSSFGRKSVVKGKNPEMGFHLSMFSPSLICIILCTIALKETLATTKLTLPLRAELTFASAQISEQIMNTLKHDKAGSVIQPGDNHTLWVLSLSLAEG